MVNVNFGELIEGGFRTWKSNFILCVPFILGMILSIVVVLAFMLPLFFAVLFPLIEQTILNPASMTGVEGFQQVMDVILQNLWLFIVVFAIMLILCGLIMSFFSAGAIGMAKEALLTGKTQISHMISYGKKKYLSYFGASLLAGLVMLVGVLFMLPGLISLFSNMTVLIENPQDPSALTFLMPLLLGIFLGMIYLLPMSIILALVPYSVVVDDVGAMEGFRKGIQVMWHNKINVFVIWLIILVVGILASLFSLIPYIGSLITLIITFLIVQPLTFVWWSKLYMTLTKPTENIASL